MGVYRDLYGGNSVNARTRGCLANNPPSVRVLGTSSPPRFSACFALFVLWIFAVAVDPVLDGAKLAVVDDARVELEPGRFHLLRKPLDRPL